MKISQRDLELKILKALIAYDDAINIATEKSIIKEYFLSKDPGIDVPITGKFFMLCEKYAQQTCGYKLTETVYENLLIKNGLNAVQQKVFMNLWHQIEDEEVQVDEVSYLFDLLKDRYIVKLKMEMMDKVSELVNQENIDSSIELITEYANEMVKIKDEFTNEKVEFGLETLEEEFFKEYDERALDPDKYRGIRIGLSQIDNKTFGFSPSQLVVLLAPSGGGKSVQMLNWANYAHNIGKKNIVYFSFEMSAWLCKLRHVALIAEVNYEKLKGVSLSAEERNKVSLAFKNINKENYFEYVEAQEDPTPEFIEAKLREITKKKGKPDMVVVDYIGNMTTRGTVKTAKQWEKNGDAAVGLHLMAKRMGITVLTAQQVNKEAIKESRKRKEDGKPGAYYQDNAAGDKRLIDYATYVIGLEPNQEENTCWYHPVKMRDAWFKPFPASFIPEYNKVEEMTDSQVSAMEFIKSADVNNDLTIKKKTIVYQENEVDLSGWAYDNDF
jgi:replicative DNA helicase